MKYELTLTSSPVLILRLVIITILSPFSVGIISVKQFGLHEWLI